MASSAAFAVLLVLAVAVQSARGMHISAAAATLKPFHYFSFIT
jgi:ABC-type molybdate transport system substrate-binding protein